MPTLYGGGRRPPRGTARPLQSCHAGLQEAIASSVDEHQQLVECRSCAARAGVLLLDLGPQPDPDMLLDPEGRRQAPTAPVRAWICASCGLVQLVGSRPAGPPGVHGHSAGPSEAAGIPGGRRSTLAFLPTTASSSTSTSPTQASAMDFIAAGLPVVGYAAARRRPLADVTGFAAGGSILLQLRRSWSRADRRAW